MNKMQEALGEQSMSAVALASGDGDIEGQMEALVGTFKQYSEQNRKLSSLYEAAKLRNQELTLAGCRIGRDIAFLREYCQSLEQELAVRGYYKHQQQEMLSRKQTADGIFLTYSEAQLGQSDPDVSSSSSSPSPPPTPQIRILNQRLQLPTTQEPDLWRKAYESQAQRVSQLQRELRQLRQLNDTLEYERQRRGAAAFVLQDRSKLFNNIHQLIGEYKRKITALAHEKKDVQRKYKQLKDKVSRLDENSEYKMIELYSQKIEVLQKLTEKQQAEIQNTIQLYEVELTKIEQRRREQIEMFQNQRLDLEEENLRLCIDLQKSLNSKDEVALQLMQEKNKNQILLQEIIQLRQAIESYKKRQAHRSNLALASSTIKLIIPPLDTSSHKRKEPSRSQVYLLRSDSQNSNTENVDYQFSQVSDKRELIQRLEDISIKRENSAKKSIRDKITITYGQPYMLKPYYGHPQPHQNKPKAPITSPKAVPSGFIAGNANKSYDSILQYKKRFIERKPQSSFNL